MECELLRCPMISYRSLLYNTTVLYDDSEDLKIKGERSERIKNTIHRLCTETIEKKIWNHL